MSTEGNPLIVADNVISSFYSALKSGEMKLSIVPGLLIRIINEDMWRERMLRNGQVVRWDTFEEFITGKPLAGLGESVQLIQRLCRDSKQALNAVDEMLPSRTQGQSFHEQAVDLLAEMTHAQREDIRQRIEGMDGDNKRNSSESLQNPDHKRRSSGSQRRRPVQAELF